MAIIDDAYNCDDWISEEAEQQDDLLLIESYCC